jgi:hypothetical protein
MNEKIYAMKKILLISLLLLSFLSYSQEMSKKELRKVKESEEFNATLALINTKNFEFSANQALPMEGPAIDLTTNPNYLIIKGDSVYCAMPFFGRAYNINYNESGGFHFSGTLENFKIDENSKKSTVNLSFKCKDTSDDYRFHMSINGGKSASLSILSDKRASISYWGELDSIKDLNPIN